MGLLLKNANIVTDKDKFLADVYIENGVISKIGENLNVKAERTIDLTGKYLMPGGIDVHTHFDIDVGIARSADNFYTGSLAAAYGGTTTIVDHMGFGPKGCNLHHQLDYYHNLAKDSVIDYSFHGVIQHIDQNILGEIDQMIEDGIPSFKGYMTYGYKLSDIEMLKLSEKLSKSGGLLTVHPENNDIIDFFREKFAAENKLSPIYHAKSRPDKCEGEAVNRMIDITNMTNCPLYIVHLSCNDALEHIKKAIDKGQKVYAETCPQYLVLDEDLYNRKDGVKYICSPPIRENSHQDKLWEGIQNGYIQTIATDHCSFNYELKKEMGEKDFRNCPNGLPGVETRMSIIFSEGVSKGRINLNKFVELVSTNPAKIFGLYPRKGVIQPGSDADLVVIRPDSSHVIDAGTQKQYVDYNPYQGMVVSHKVQHVFLRGQKIIEDGAFKTDVPAGNYLLRNTLVR